MDPVLLDRILQRADDRLLPDVVAESLRTIFARERLVGHGGSISAETRSEEPRWTAAHRGCTLSLLPSGPDEVRCACCTGPGLIPAGLGRVTEAPPEFFPMEAEATEPFFRRPVSRWKEQVASPISENPGGRPCDEE